MRTVKGIRSVIILLFIISTLSVSAQQYVGSIATFKNLSTYISADNYDGSITITTNESITINGVNQNKTIPVDWLVIGVSEGDSGSYLQRTISQGGYSINYQLYDSISSRNVLMSKADATSLNDLLTIYVGGQTRKFTANSSFEFEIPAGQYISTGTYSDQSLTVELWGLLDLAGDGPQTELTFADLPNLELLDSQVISYNTYAAASINSSIIEHDGAFEFTSTPYSMNFGTLDPDEVQQADLIIEALVPYSIEVQSTYGSKLKHETVDAYVEYKFFFENVWHPLSPGSPASLVPYADASSSPGDRYPIDIQISSLIDFVPAGDYYDYLTFTIIGN